MRSGDGKNNHLLSIEEERRRSIVSFGDMDPNGQKGTMAVTHEAPPAYSPPGQGYSGVYVPQGHTHHISGYPSQQLPHGQTYIPMTTPSGGIVYTQPGVAPTAVVVTPVMVNPPADHMIFNIMMTVFCCWPIGIFAIMRSMACRDAVHRGDQANAVRLSKEARRLGFWALGAGIALMVVFVAVIIVFYVVTLVP